MESVDVKPVVSRLYGRQISRPLRKRQKYLLETILPKLRLTLPQCEQWGGVFPSSVTKRALEIGFGGGEHLLEKIRHSPQTGFIGSEVFVNGLCSLLSKLYPPSEQDIFVPPQNLKIWDEDARKLLSHLPLGSLDEIYLMFPDPWPKKRHAKRRFVHPQNVKEVARVLKHGGSWYVASDDPTYQEWVGDVMETQNWFDTAYVSLKRPQECFPTRYERKAIEAGRTPLYWIFSRNENVVTDDK